MNNTTFSFGRFGAYALAELFLHRVAILRVFLVYTLIVTSYYLLPLLIGGSTSNAPTSFFVFGVTMGIIIMAIYGAQAFEVFRKPGGGTFAMQIPVSMAEKFIFRLIGHMLLAPLLAVTIPRLIWLVIASIYNIPGDSALFSEFFTPQLVGAAMIQSTFFFGAIVFRKSNFIKTVFCWLVLTIVIQVIFHLSTVYGKWVFSVNFTNDAVVFGYGLTILVTLFFVVMAWFRFRKLAILK